MEYFFLPINQEKESAKTKGRAKNILEAEKKTESTPSSTLFMPKENRTNNTERIIEVPIFQFFVISPIPTINIAGTTH